MTMRAAQILVDQMYLAAENKKQPDTMARVPFDHVPNPLRRDCIVVWRSKDFVCQVHKAPVPGVLRLSINRTMINDAGEWVDGITWDDLMRIKREVGYGDKHAIEVYPADEDIVNVANLRHLWILPEPHPVAWLKVPRT